MIESRASAKEVEAHPPPGTLARASASLSIRLS